MVATAVKTITKKTSIKESKSKGLSELEAQRRELFGSTKKVIFFTLFLLKISGSE